MEQIIAKLREIEKLTGQGMSMPMAAKRVGITLHPTDSLSQWENRLPS